MVKPLRTRSAVSVSKPSGQREALAQAHPPRVAEPEEGRAVGVREVAAIGADFERPVLVVGVCAGVGLHVQRELLIVQIAVLRV